MEENPREWLRAGALLLSWLAYEYTVAWISTPSVTMRLIFWVIIAVSAWWAISGVVKNV
jgi:hypothetical protein